MRTDKITFQQWTWGALRAGAYETFILPDGLRRERQAGYTSALVDTLAQIGEDRGLIAQTWNYWASLGRDDWHAQEEEEDPIERDIRDRADASRGYA